MKRVEILLTARHSEVLQHFTRHALSLPLRLAVSLFELLDVSFNGLVFALIVWVGVRMCVPSSLLPRWCDAS